MEETRKGGDCGYVWMFQKSGRLKLGGVGFSANANVYSSSCSSDMFYTTRWDWYILTAVKLTVKTPIAAIYTI
jgi:hypothetical protein